jgi:hypothetical protein
MTIFQSKRLVEPPDDLDGAVVLFWAYSPRVPFFIMEFSDGTPYKPIHGFAICRYKDDSKYYKFSCDREWIVENDIDADSINEAKQIAISQTKERINWNKK